MLSNNKPLKFTKCLVISAINIVEGGTLTILRDAIKTARYNLDQSWRIVALVNSSAIFSDVHGVDFMEFPCVKRSWFLRIYQEWFGFFKLSRKIRPLIWLSLHDMTPNVFSAIQAVYCHNPSPFYKAKVIEAYYDPTFYLFTRFYKYLYRINIRRNKFVFVQQDWIRNEFTKMFDIANVCVMHPVNNHSNSQTVENLERSPNINNSKKIRFIYPALPRVFKNFEVLCDAVELCSDSVKSRIEILLTVDGSENRYASDLIVKYKHIPQIKFIGRQSKDAMLRLYSSCAAMLFPSKLETWGLPISEAKYFNLPIFVSDSIYAKETVGEYDQVVFIDPLSSNAWSAAIEFFANNTLSFVANEQVKVADPFVSNWDVFWKMLECAAIESSSGLTDA